MTDTSDPQHPSRAARHVNAFAVDLDSVPVEGEGDIQSGHLRWQTIVAAERTPSSDVVVGVATFPAHGCLKLHHHEPAEFYFGLTGDGIVTAGDQQLRIAKDVTVFIPGGTPHGVIAGAAGLTMLYGFGRSTYDDIIYHFADDAPVPSPLTRPRRRD